MTLCVGFLRLNRLYIWSYTARVESATILDGKTDPGLERASGQNGPEPISSGAVLGRQRAACVPWCTGQGWCRRVYTGRVVPGPTTPPWIHTTRGTARTGVIHPRDCQNRCYSPAGEPEVLLTTRGRTRGVIDHPRDCQKRLFLTRGTARRGYSSPAGGPEVILDPRDQTRTPA